VRASASSRPASTPSRPRVPAHGSSSSPDSLSGVWFVVATSGSVPNFAGHTRPLAPLFCVCCWSKFCPPLAIQYRLQVGPALIGISGRSTPATSRSSLGLRERSLSESRMKRRTVHGSIRSQVRLQARRGLRSRRRSVVPWLRLGTRLVDSWRAWCRRTQTRRRERASSLS